ncbi:MAG: AAA family ATPase [Candidatus Aminicenantes bacterium]|nr:AAA family ATPase [Candidatus Aminicenantes bacterium]
MKFINRLFQESVGSFFIFGPRGTGKSTWLKTRYPDSILIDLLEPDLYRGYSARPERLRAIVEGNPNREIIIIDEIQKVPQLLDPVHALMEEKPHLRFILTGSSSRKLKHTGVDLLSGRAALRWMHPFLASELGVNFDLPAALKNGLVPVIHSSRNPAEALKAYIELYIKEEVMVEGLVRNTGNFARFLESISFSHGSVLNASTVARECEVERKTVQGYIEILKDLLLAFFVPVFTRRAKRAVVQHPKFYIFDPGVFYYLRPRGPLDRPEEMEGAALEGLVAQHLRAWIDYSFSSCKLYYWRTKTGSEVDFVVYGEEGFWAFEVKNSKKIHPADLRGLKTFAQDYPECTPVFLYRGEETLKIDQITCLPCEKFLKQLQGEKNWAVP